MEKFGDPNGIVRFDVAAQLPRTVQEPTGSTTLRFPLYRRQGTIGDIEVWENVYYICMCNVIEIFVIKKV